MNNKIGLGLSSGGAANPPTMGPAYTYSWAVDFGRIPALDANGDSFLNFGDDTSDNFPSTDEGPETQLASPQPDDGIRVECVDDSTAPALTKFGFPAVRSGGTFDDAEKYFPPHATHSGIPIGAVSLKYKYLTLAITYHSTTSGWRTCGNTPTRNYVGIGSKASGYVSIGGGNDTTPQYRNGVKLSPPHTNAGMTADDRDTMQWITWDLSLADEWPGSGESEEESEAWLASFDPNEFTHHVSGVTSDPAGVFSVTYHGIILSSDVPSGSDLKLPIHTTRPAI